MKWIRSLCTLFTAGLLGACASTLEHAVVYTPPPSRHLASQLRVGTGRADITMPPGAATFGHALDSRVAEGYWTRTYCRVFFFETAWHERLAIIPCELAAPSQLLQREVARRVAGILHPSQIMMTAIHTHAGVAHYFGEGQYTGPFSTRKPAFDQQLLYALADRIADAIKHAQCTAKPARLAWSHGNDFFCFEHNRDLAAYDLNAHPFQPTPKPGDFASCEQYAERRDYLAVDPAIDVLRIDAIDPADSSKNLGPIGSISLFAMHPTILPSSNRLFGGDTTGMVNRDVEHELRSEWLHKHPELAACVDHPGVGSCPTELPDPLHGVINTNEGDIAPNWTRGDTDEAILSGHRLAQFVWQHHPPETSGAPERVLDLRYLEDDIRGAKYHDPDQQLHTTCDYPELGQGSAGGATDHRTTVSGLPMFETAPAVRAVPQDCQGVKRPLLGPLSCLGRAEGAFPDKLPLAVVQLDDTLLAFLPAEATITAGHHITERMLAVAHRYPGAPTRALIAGLANSYIQYLATADEYALQGYEGASTLYGPNENAYFADRMALLTRSILDPSHDSEIRRLGKVDDVSFPVGSSSSRERMAQPTGDRRDRKALRTCTMPGPGTARVCMYWRDDGPGDVPLHAAQWLRLIPGETAADATAEPLRICRKSATGACDLDGRVDDRGHEFRTRIHQEVGDGFIWSTLFSPDAALWQELGSTRVRIEAQGRPPAVRSNAFAADALPCTCSAREARLCTEGERTNAWQGLVPPTPRAECGDLHP